jgi:hypothetical protein
MPVGGWCQCGKAGWVVDGVEKWDVRATSPLALLAVDV